MASEQAVVLHSQERPVYINKGSALTQNLIFSAALAGAGTYGLLALQHTLRTGSHWVDATAPNGYSLYQFAYGVIGSVIQNFKIDKAMAALLGKAYDFDRFCRIGGGLLLASLISIAAVLLVTVVYNIVNLAYLHRVNKMEKAEALHLGRNQGAALEPGATGDPPGVCGAELPFAPDLPGLCGSPVHDLRRSSGGQNRR